jgi:Amt family ammonium transporter
VLTASFVLWYVVKSILGARLSETEEKDGADKSEIGLSSYPEFIQ